jgi:hypothetical protein
MVLSLQRASRAPAHPALVVLPVAIPAPGNKKPAGEGGCDSHARSLSGGGTERPRPGFRLLPPKFLQDERCADAVGELAPADLVTHIAIMGSEVRAAQSPASVPSKPNGRPVGRFASPPDETNSAR